MDDCPYCGAEVEKNSVQCPTCMAVLREVDDSTMEDLEKRAEKKQEQETQTVACPKCEARNLKKNRRCAECGAMIDAPVEVADQAAWKYGPWVAFGGIGAAVLFVLIIAIWITAKPVQEKRTYANATLDRLVRMYEPSRYRSQASKLQPDWDSKYNQRYLKASGTVIKMSGYEVELAITETGKKDKKSEVLVEFESLPSGTAVGKEIGFEARLERLHDGEFVFTLVKGGPVE
jgi:DNA-directed RNA polymerase subunit RPC12/RpoP